MDEFSKQTSNTNQNEIVCKNCAAKLTFAPGTTRLKCDYCGTINEIKIDTQALNDAIRENDYLEALENISSDLLEEIHTVKCNCCGAQTTFDPNVISAQCDFCGSPITVDQKSTSKVIKPKAVLPFKVDKNQGYSLFGSWISGLWFAPNDLKTSISKTDKLSGMYLPYWTYDADTDTFYTGQRGDDYEVEESYTDSDGESQTRTVTKTRWTRTSGNVHNTFDDIFVVGSRTLPENFMDGLEPWNLNELVPYDEKFLSGFKTETYGVDLKDGFTVAQEKMQPEIDNSIRYDIGGDRQQISTKDINYYKITFKHILLPVWISAYKYKEKVYRFIINGQSGKIQGERPISRFKVALAIVAAVAVIGVLAWLFNK